MKRIKSSEFIGVNTIKNGSKYAARIVFKGKSHFLGYYFLEVDAAKAYDYIGRELINKNIRKVKLNFPLDMIINSKELSHKSNRKR